MCKVPKRQTLLLRLPHAVSECRRMARPTTFLQPWVVEMDAQLIIWSLRLLLLGQMWWAFGFYSHNTEVGAVS